MEGASVQATRVWLLMWSHRGRGQGGWEGQEGVLSPQQREERERNPMWVRTVWWRLGERSLLRTPPAASPTPFSQQSKFHWSFPLLHHPSAHPLVDGPESYLKKKKVTRSEFSQHHDPNLYLLLCLHPWYFLCLISTFSTDTPSVFPGNFCHWSSDSLWWLIPSSMWTCSHPGVSAPPWHCGPASTPGYDPCSLFTPERVSWQEPSSQVLLLPVCSSLWSRCSFFIQTPSKDYKYASFLLLNVHLS